MLFRTVFASVSVGGVALAKGAFVVKAKAANNISGSSKLQEPDMRGGVNR